MAGESEDGGQLQDRVPRWLDARRVSWQGWLYAAIALALLIWTIVHFGIRSCPPLLAFVLVGLLVYMARFGRTNLVVKMPRRRLMLTYASSVYLAAGLLVSPPIGALFAIIAETAEGLYARKDFEKTLANVTANVVALSVGASVAVELHGRSYDGPIQSGSDVVPIFIGAIVATLLHMLTFSAVASSILKASPFSIIASWKETVLTSLISVPLDTALITIVLAINPLLFPMVMIPILLLAITARRVTHVEEQAADTLRHVSDLVEIRERHTHQHSLRVEAMVRELLKRYPDVDVLDGERIVQAARIHDVGKIGIPDSILLKPARLTPEEFEVMTTHVTTGAELLERITEDRVLADIVRHHHERWDGSGYPDKLAGTAIPMGSRIISVVDSFDAMCDVRPYHEPMTPNDALSELERFAGSQFDPEIVQSFVTMMRDGFESPVTGNDPAIEETIASGT